MEYFKIQSEVLFIAIFLLKGENARIRTKLENI